MFTSIIAALQIFVSIAALTMEGGGAGAVTKAGGADNALLVFMLYLYRQGFSQFRMGYASALITSGFR